MELIINNKEINFKDIEPKDLYKILMKSNFKITDIDKKFQQSIFCLENYLIKDPVISTSYFFKQKSCLREEIERTRRIKKRISDYIPNKIEQVKNEKKTLIKQSFRLNKSQLKKREQDISNRFKKYKKELKVYKLELKIRKKYIYKFYSSMIPSLYIIKRPKYNIIQCKWKFLGITQKQIHIGTLEKVGNLDNDKLKEIIISKINLKYSGTFTDLTYKWIEKEKKKLNKWCSDMNYRQNNS